MKKPGLLRIVGVVLAGTALTSLAATLHAQEVPLPGFGDVYNTTAIIGVIPGQSYVRFANLRDEPVTNSVEIYGLDDKETLGSFQIEVPAKASIQIEPHLMIETFAPVNWRQPVVLYVQNGRDKQLWQHVKYDWRAGALRDASVCTYAPHADYIPDAQTALNVHINRVGSLSSHVGVHNFTDRTGIFEARLYNADTGESMGRVDITLKPRESLTQSGLWYQDNAVDVPVQRDLPGTINIAFVPKAPDSGARLSVSHAVFDYMTGQTTNLSNPCPIHGGLITLPPIDQPQ